MIPSAFPLRHLSIRVPWHDNGWNGTVCCHPTHNSACLKLKNISDSKDEAREELIKGRSLEDLPPADFPPCVRERASFMANFAFERFHEHPYAKSSPDTHAHFAPTRLHYPAFGAAALPFRWMMREEVEKLKNRHPLGDFDLSREPELPFKTGWVQNKENHLCLLDTFWRYIRKEKSLVFFYAKQVPFVEDTNRRILIGVGRVKGIGPLTEYEYRGGCDEKIRSMLWERMVTHSIRENERDGFLLPYGQLLRAADENPDLDLAEFAVFAPMERFEEFSYATEHVTDDSAIAALAALREGLRKASSVLSDFNPRKLESWIDHETGRLWQKRGPFPGLGAVLCAFGVHLGHFAAHAVQTKAGENGDPWPLVDLMFHKPDEVLSQELASNVDATLRKAWQGLSSERRAYLQLLARINLTDEHLEILYEKRSREEIGLTLSDQEILENPYLIYEATRLTLFPASVLVVDRGVFPTPAIREKYPVPEPSRVTTAVDARRLRALVISELEHSALTGDTLRTRDAIIADLRAGTDEKDTTRVTEDLLTAAENATFGDEIRLVKMDDGRLAYQLDRLASIGAKIRETVNKRTGAKAKPLAVQADWRKELDKFLARPVAECPDPEAEESARVEKSAALAELARSRFSVLVGSAGTGKTTLLSVLCAHPNVVGGHILLLAPTGKARVRLESMARKAGTQNFKAATIAQFLWRSNRYDGVTGRYQLQPNFPAESGYRTLIVDEASMLTEEMLAALFEGLEGVHRLILVGDSGQLPPIGAGRPFVDIVRKMQPDDIESRFPRVSSGYAELTIPRRQGATDRDDLQLASWFAARASGPGDDEIFDILTGQQASPHLRLVEWNTASDIDRLLPRVLAEELALPDGPEASKVFAQTLGGNEYQGTVYFHPGWLGPEGDTLHGADRWQILSPVRQKPWGVDEINRLLHRTFRAQTLAEARQHPFKRKIPPPLGPQQLVYGDKVINNRNQRPSENRIFDPQGKGAKYLANGELGLVTGFLRTQKRNWVPKDLEIEFSTQPGVTYTFYASDFAEESETKLELAYALTVHKAQGSEFGRVFLVLPRNTLLLNRELLYTALTRQKEKIILLHQGPATELLKFSQGQFSNAARRLTNLFAPPRTRAVGEKGSTFLEDRLIHLTDRGDLVRSKSEVIIADHLHRAGIPYTYERSLTFDGALRFPDFTIEDEDTGITYYWEHCGMLADPGYLRRWKAKLVWYRDHGILPHEEGGGPNGTLIVTKDTMQGGISSRQIAQLIKQVLKS